MKLSDYEYYRTDLGVLYCGDCMEIMPLIDEKVDLVLTDPMYNISQEKKIKRSKFYNPKYKRPSDIDFNFFGEQDKLNLQEYLEFSQAWIIETFNIMKEIGSIYCFFPRSEISYLEKIMNAVNFKVRSTCVWHKNNPIPNQLNISFSSACEFFTFATKTKGKKHTFNSGKGKQNVFKYPLCQGNERTTHPTQKPLNLIMELIKISSNKDDLVLDLFAGSGTTAVACEKLQRRWIGIEISEQYCEIAKQRIMNEYNQIKLEL